MINFQILDKQGNPVEVESVGVREGVVLIVLEEYVAKEPQQLATEGSLLDRLRSWGGTMICPIGKGSSSAGLSPWRR